MILPDNESTRQQAADVITAGGVLAFRTDTFYGLGADPFNVAALKRLKFLKAREEWKPILVVISEASVAERFISETSELFQRVCERHWPGALTIVVKASAEVPDDLTAGTGTVGLRLPDDHSVRELIESCGGALTATSANLSGEPPAHTAQEVFGSFPTGLDLIIDGGPARSDLPSTVLDLSRDEPRLIREGVVTKEALAKTLHELGSHL